MKDEAYRSSNNKAGLYNSYVGLLVVNVNSNAEYGSASLFTLEPKNYMWMSSVTKCWQQVGSVSVATSS